MQDRKKVVASISLVVFAGRIVFYRVWWGTKLQDPEFDTELIWAEQTWIKNIENIRAYPFSPVSRKEAAQWYVLLAQDIWLVPDGNKSECVFADISMYDEITQNRLELACMYEFFKWTDGNFYPDAYVTKANSLVALIRWLSPAREFELVQPYRTPYVNLAYEQGITQRPSWPYLMYLITKYELLLQLWRVHELKS
jgi:hypothetical protein